MDTGWSILVNVAVIAQGTDDELIAALRKPATSGGNNYYTVGGWNYYGDHQVVFQGATVSSSGAPGGVSTTGEMVGLPVFLLGSVDPVSGEGPYGGAVMVDLDPTSSQSTQIYVGGLQIGVDTPALLVRANTRCQRISWIALRPEHRAAALPDTRLRLRERHVSTRIPARGDRQLRRQLHDSVGDRQRARRNRHRRALLHVRISFPAWRPTRCRPTTRPTTTTSTRRSAASSGPSGRGCRGAGHRAFRAASSKHEAGRGAGCGVPRHRGVAAHARYLSALQAQAIRTDGKKHRADRPQRRLRRSANRGRRRRAGHDRFPA